MFKTIVMILSVLISSLFSHTTFANEVWQIKHSDRIEYWVFYVDELGWVGDHFTQPHGDLQDKDQSVRFPTLESIQKFITKNLTLYSPKTLSMQSDDFEPQSVIFPQTNKVLWEANNEWNEDWELQYKDWFENTFDENFFRTYNVKTDCADAAYAARWIFARLNSLPAGAQLAGSGQLITQATVKKSWKNLSRHNNWWQDELFMTALEYVMNNTYTHTLNQDTFPVKINSKTIIPGTIFLTLNSQSGHTMQVSHIDGNQNIRLVWSNLPRIVRTLDVSSFRPNDQPSLSRGGLIRHRWIYQDEHQNWRMKAKDQMPDYSLEQYDSTFMENYNYFYEAVKARVFAGNSIEDLADLKDAIELVDYQLRLRKDIVNSGYEFCQQQNCSENSVNYNNWSTPSRDKKIKDIFIQIQSLLLRNKNNDVANYWLDMAKNLEYHVYDNYSIS
ncbi:MAG: hypothetical protein KDD40_11170, partial [Bdellovibrionales bacterium]|nr:hypothetical protein [Bdellovibrionales bacterium]